MAFPKIREKVGPEAKIQAEIIQFLRAREWFTKETHGNMYQQGFPDVYATHHFYGARWIEVKNEAAYSFTPAQLIDFPRFEAAGAGVWIMVAATEAEYQKLAQPCNWRQYYVRKVLNGR